MDPKEHREHLQRLCRISRYSRRNNKQYQCEMHMKLLKKVYDISVEDDDIDCIPRTFCHKCYCVMKKSEDAMEKRKEYHSSTTVVQWQGHKEGETCSTCEVYYQKQKGGRSSKKGKIPGRPKQNTQPASIISQIICLAMSIAPSPTMPPESDPLPSSCILPQSGSFTVSDFTCPKCKCLYNQPLQLKCQHIVCLKCCLKHFESQMSPTCPICSISLTLDDIKIPPPIISHALEAVKLRCPMRCGQMITYGQMIRHDCNDKQVISPSHMTLKDVCNVDITKTPTESEW